MRNLLPNLREIGASAVQPTARPTDTFTAPQAPVRDFGGADSVLSSLSNIMPSLNRFIERRDEEAQRQGEDKAQNAIAGLSFEQRKALIDNNELPDNQDPWFRAALLKGHGRRVAQEQYEDILRKQESGELNFATTDDAREYLNKTFNDTVEAFGGDHLMTTGYRELFSRVSEATTKAQAAYEGKLLGQARQDQFFSEARKILTEESGKSEGTLESRVKTAHERIRNELYPTFESLFRMKPKDMDALLVTFAEEAADQGNTALVNEILFSDRTDPVTGNVVGRIGDKREFAAKANDIIVKADAAQGRIVRQGTRGALSMFRQQARDGKLNTKDFEQFQQQYGRWLDPKEFERIDNLQSAAVAKALSEADRAADRAIAEARLKARIAADNEADERIELGLGAAMPTTLFTNPKTGMREELGNGATLANEALDRRMQAIAQQVEKGTLDATEGLRQMADVQRRNGMVWKNWKAIMEVGPGSLSDKEIAEGKIPDTLKRGYQLYRQVASVAPEIADQAAGTRAGRVYQAMVLAQQYLGLDESQAALGAIRANRTDTNNNLAMQQTREEIKRRSDSVISGGWFGSNAKQSSFRVREQLIDLADTLAKGYGIDPQSALEKAAEGIKARTISYRGHLIPMADLGAMSQDFDTYFKPFAEEWFKVNGETQGVKKVSDLAVSSLGNGRLILFDNRNLRILPFGERIDENGKRVPMTGELSARTLYERYTTSRAEAANANRNR